MDVIDVHAPMGDPEPPAAPAPAAAPRAVRLQFTGTGAEYFRIWIVNLLLTIVTLGIYSAWAKVRKMQYFYRNTHLDGSVFDYHGDPLAILKGRIIAVLLVVLYKLALTLLGAYALLAAIGLFGALPWLLTQSYRFRLHNSSYRGLRFRFDGPVSQAYLIFGLPALLVLLPGTLAALGLRGDPRHPDGRLMMAMGLMYLVLMLLWPYLHYRLKRWQHGNAAYGTARARFEAYPGSFYAPYLAAAAMLLVVLFAGGMLMASLGFVLKGGPGIAPRELGIAVLAWVVLFYLAVFSTAPLVSAWIQNATWSNTRIEGVRFASDAGARRLIGITLTNLLMVVFSLGFLIPFAMTRLLKFKIEAIQVLDADALANFAAEAQQGRVGAVGEGAVDVMELDFGL